MAILDEVWVLSSILFKYFIILSIYNLPQCHLLSYLNNSLYQSSINLRKSLFVYEVTENINAHWNTTALLVVCLLGNKAHAARHMTKTRCMTAVHNIARFVTLMLNSALLGMAVLWDCPMTTTSSNSKADRRTNHISVIRNTKQILLYQD